MNVRKGAWREEKEGTGVEGKREKAKEGSLSSEGVLSQVRTICLRRVIILLYPCTLWSQWDGGNPVL